MKQIWVASTTLESLTIGIAFGGWAECTYWSGCGWVVGLAVWFFAFGGLAIIRDREDERRRNDRKRKTASPYAKG